MNGRNFNAANYNIISAIRGPLLLIALGTLVTMDYFEGIRFSRTWPILLIILGILKLLERIAPKPAPIQPNYVDTQRPATPPPGDSVI